MISANVPFELILVLITPQNAYRNYDSSYDSGYDDTNNSISSYSIKALKNLKGYFEKYSILSSQRDSKNIKIHFQIVKMSDTQNLINTMKCALGRFELLFEHLKFYTAQK